MMEGRVVGVGVGWDISCGILDFFLFYVVGVCCGFFGRVSFGVFWIRGVRVVEVVSGVLRMRGLGECEFLSWFSRLLFGY